MTYQTVKIIRTALAMIVYIFPYIQRSKSELYVRGGFMWKLSHALASLGAYPLASQRYI